MAKFDQVALRAELKRLAKPAKSDLAWLAAYHAFFKNSQQHAPASAASMLTLPQLTLGVPVEQFATPQAARLSWEQAVQSFDSLRAHAFGQARDDPGHYLNKAAVVYAVAIIEGFLLDAFEITWGKAYPNVALPRCPASVRTFVGVLGSLRDHRGEQKSGCYVGDNYAENSLGWARDAIFLAEIRHAIVHKQGRVDKAFLEKVGAEKNSNGKPDEIWDHQTWQTVNDFVADFKQPEPDPSSGETKYYQVCLNISKTIIPYMPKCVAFIEDSIEKLITAARGWPKNP